MNHVFEYSDISGDFVPNLIKSQATFTTWKIGKRVKSIAIGDRIIKDVRSWTCKEEALEALDKWRGNGLTGAPASAAGFYHKLNQFKFASYSQNHLFDDAYIGGWQEAFKVGNFQEAYKYYDIISAYYWASNQGFPFRVQMFNPKCNCHLLRVKVDSGNFPTCLNSDVITLDNDDIDAYNIKGTILTGVSWNKSDVLNMDYSFENVYKLNLNYETWKQLKRTYWGLWSSRRELVREHYIEGKLVTETKYKNRRVNLIWSVLITRRVLRRLFGVVDSAALLVQTDAVLTPNPISVGGRDGDFKLKAVYKGVFIRSSGVWTVSPVPLDVANYTKHSGTKGAL